MTTTTLRLTSRGATRARAGHPWVFSNELEGGLRGLADGQVVDLQAPTGGFVARALASPHDLVAARILTWNRREDVLHPAALAGRLRQAESARAMRYPGRRDLRLVNGEGDGLPGLEVDRFGDALLVRLRFPGWGPHLAALQEALVEVFAPAGVWLVDQKNTVSQWYGDCQDEVTIEVDGLHSRVRPGQGPGASYFYDQADLHALVAPWCKGGRVLDAYGFNGAAARRALLAGATSAVVVEKEEAWCELAADSAALDGLTDRLRVFCDEGKRAMQGFANLGERYEVIFLDPPTFARTKKDVKGAVPGHVELHALAMTLLAPGGVLVTSLRGIHVPPDEFERALGQAALDAGRTARVLHRLGPAADHVEAPSVTEARWLQSYVLHVAL